MREPPDRPHARTRPVRPETVTLTYDLEGLPSPQHRAGLAGLVMMVQWLDLRPDVEKKGTCRLDHLSERRASFTFDAPGLEHLFDWHHAELDSPPRNGALLRALDPAGSGQRGLWLDLWCHFVSRYLRGAPAARAPLAPPAETPPLHDTRPLQRAVLRSPDVSVPLPSACCLDARTEDDESDVFQDPARWQLLLHFWPYSTQVYVPRVLDPRHGTTTFDGWVLALPDVDHLDLFTADLVSSLVDRPTDPLAHLPRAAVIDHPAEAALRTATLLRGSALTRGARLAPPVTAYDLYQIHETPPASASPKPRPRARFSGRLDPTDLVPSYEALRSSFTDPLFLHRRLTNFFEDHRLRHLPAHEHPSIPWYAGFDRDAAAASPDKAFFGSRGFRRDARQAFLLTLTATATARPDNPPDSPLRPPSPLDALVYRLVRDHIRRQVQSKYNLDIDLLKQDPSHQKALQEARETIARDTFLAIRSRPPHDFATYFTSTFTPTPHRLHDLDHLDLLTTLHDDRRRTDLRTLTLLALTAVAWSPSPESKPASPRERRR